MITNYDAFLRGESLWKNEYTSMATDSICLPWRNDSSPWQNTQLLLICHIRSFCSAY